jgi:hypothetical protein
MRDRLDSTADRTAPQPDFREVVATGDAATFVEDFLRLAEWLRDRSEAPCDPR